MTLMRPRNRLSEMPTLRQAIDRLFDESFVRPAEWLTAPFEGVFTPPIDAFATKDAFVVKVALPGMEPENVETTIESDTLSIHGTFEVKEEKEKVGYVVRELARGEFRRSLVLPVGLRLEATEATFKDGILTLTIPKAEAAKPRKIEIKNR